MSRDNPITDFLDRSGLLVIDGGLATELERRGYDLNDELWSAHLLIDDPDAIYQVHRDYLLAGADCIISASYQATIEGFMGKGVDEEGAEELLCKAVQIALDARDDFWSYQSNRQGRIRPLVAASIGPYGAALADGSEYTGDYDLDEDGLYDFHKRRWQILSRTRADILACETIPSYPETKALVRLITETPDRYAWICFSCQDNRRINDGTPIARCIQEIVGLNQVAAVGINCTAPRFILGLIDEIKANSSKPIIVYPNSGEHFEPDTREWLGQAAPDNFAQASKSWRSKGAQLIGGCCRTGPEHISQIRELLLPKSI
ncbi:MAG: homocysteine S-methyltransferase [Anaerolineae bacterium]|nr:MAG: homocysteine S-methyltransferase [Anaerolineae bacterium]